MTSEPTNVEKLRGLPWSIAANAANTVFVQFTFFGSVFVLFLSALGLSKTQMGLLLSLLPFSGLIALFIAPAVARFGYKRTYLVFFSARKAVTAFLLLTPWVLARYGGQITLFYVGGIVALFAILRSVAMTAMFPWTQEYVPNSVRGKYTATSNMFTTFAGFLSVFVAGFVIERSSGLAGYMILIAAGVGLGAIAIWASAHIPGGEPVQELEVESKQHRDLRDAIVDGNFLRYLLGVGLISLATAPLNSFLPLFMQEQVGLSPGNVVFLQMGTLWGGLLSSYLWGWAADRYGSKPIMVSGIGVRLLLPIAWVLMPRNSEWSLAAALAIATIQGLADMGWGIGSGRLLYVSIVPPDKKRDYMALYYAFLGVVGGISQLLGGRILDFSQGISGQILIFPLSEYTPLFLIGLSLPLLSILLFRGVQADSLVSLGQFAGIFYRGNPFLAMGSLIRYHLARDEEATVRMTERLGQARSLLTVEELLESLEDPRFNVRFEAIVSIARTEPDDRLIGALEQVLAGSEPALSVIAAWALGRLGDEKAIGSLHRGLSSHYRSVQAHSTRSLGTLGDKEIIPVLTERLQHERDLGLQIAYASTLGKLGARGATGKLLEVLDAAQDQPSRMELALALARLVGDEHHYIQLLRQMRSDPGTTASQAISALQKKVDKAHLADSNLDRLMESCAEVLAREDLDEGATLIRSAIELLPLAALDETQRLILRDCAEHLAELRAARQEYLHLALHTLYMAWQS